MAHPEQGCAGDRCCASPAGVPACPRGSLQCSAWFCGNAADFSPGPSGVPLCPCHPCGSPGVAQPEVLPVSLFLTALFWGLDPLVLPGITPGSPGISGCLFWGSPWWRGYSCEPSPCHIPVTNPVPLSPACLFRYNVLSLVYLLFLLLLPWFPGPSPHFTTGKGLTWGCRGGTGEVGSRAAATPSCRHLACGFTLAGQRGSVWSLSLLIIAQRGYE